MLRANKTEVKEAIEAIFGVNVDKVNIMNYKPKAKRVGTSRWFHKQSS